jgi:hypothetical protein
VVLGGVTADGHIVAAYWNGSAEILAFIDPATSTFMPVGSFETLRYWQDQLAYDVRRNVVYANGQDANYHSYLYSLALDSGASTRVDAAGTTDLPCYADGGCPSPNRQFAGVRSDGRIVAAFSTGAAQEVTLIDPSTGTSTSVGTLGSLSQWQRQFVYDDASHVVYAGGDDGAGNFNMYTLALDTLKLTTVPFVTPTGTDCDGACIPVNGAFGGITNDGKVIVVFWNGVERSVVLTDPGTGASTYVGHLQGFEGPQIQVVYDPIRRIVYTGIPDNSNGWVLSSLQLGN